MSIRLLIGDCREQLKLLADESVNCVVTSPPYYGLRDYQTGTWEGGDSTCDHVVGEMRRGLGLADSPANTRGGAIKVAEVEDVKARDVCPKCGARRVDRQIGLEATPEGYIATMVEVFREVRRVLRSDGTLFLNMGDSYASQATRGGRAYGSGGRERSGSRARDSFSIRLCGVCRETLISGRILRNDRSHASEQSASRDLSNRAHREFSRAHLPMSGSEGQIGHSSGATQCHRQAEGRGGAQPHGAPGSTNPEFSPSLQRESRLQTENQDDVCQSCGGSLDGYVLLSLHRAECNRGSTSSASASRTSSRDVLGSAYQCSTSASLKPKDLVGIPWMLAFALRADGWWLRQDIIWAKPNPMPESVTDRCTKAHEYLFLLSKSERYYWDQAAIAEEVTLSTVARLSQPNLEEQAGSARANGGTRPDRPMKAVESATSRSARDSFKREGSKREQPIPGQAVGTHRPDREESAWDVGRRNKRSVWTIATAPFSEAHFATFPPALVEPCILAGCPVGGTVLDPFFGAGTTGLVADRLGRDCVGIELNQDYAAIAERRIHKDAGMFAEVAAQ